MRWFFGILGVVGAVAFYVWQGFVLYESGAMQASGFEWTVAGATVSLAGIGSVALLIFEASLLPASSREFRRGNWMTGSLGIVVLAGITVTMVVMDIEGLLTARADRAAERQQIADGTRNITVEISAAESERNTWLAKLESSRVTRADIRFLSEQLAATNRRVDALRTEQRTAKTNGGASPAPAFFSELDGGKRSEQWWLLTLMITGIVVRAVLRATMFFIAMTLFEADPKDRRKEPFDFKRLLDAKDEPATPANDATMAKASLQVTASPAAMQSPLVHIVKPSEEALLREVLEGLPYGPVQFADIEGRFGSACLKNGFAPKRERTIELLAALKIGAAKKGARGARYTNHLGSAKGQASKRAPAIAKPAGGLRVAYAH